jgi:hypothetical protein
VARIRTNDSARAEPRKGWVKMKVSWLPRLGASCLIVRAPYVSASSSTSYITLVAQARGEIPNAFGPVKAKVSGTLQLSIQLNLNAGAGYAAGTVTATTDSKGRVVRMAKGKQASTAAYTSTGAIRSVVCSTSTRRLDGDLPSSGGLGDAEAAAGPQEEGGSIAIESDPSSLLRRLAPSSSDCATLVSSSPATRVRLVCGSRFTVHERHPRGVPVGKDRGCGCLRDADEAGKGARRWLQDLSLSLLLQRGLPELRVLPRSAGVPGRKVPHRGGLSQRVQL